MTLKEPVGRTPREYLEFQAHRNHHGVMLRQDALAAGMTKTQIDRRVRRGQWLSGPGRSTLILAEFGHRPETWLYAANLAFGAIAWGRSALALWNLNDHPVRPIVACQRRPKCASIDLVSVRDLIMLPQTKRSGVKTATLEIALASLAANTSRQHLDELADEALRRGLTTLARVETAFGLLARRGRPGSRLLRQICTDRSIDPGVPLSGWSRQVADKLVRSGLPRPVMEHRVMSSELKLVAQVDLAYPIKCYAIELDSLQFHLNAAAFEVDRRRDADLAQLGWRVSRFTWAQITNDWGWVLSTIRSQIG